MLINRERKHPHAVDIVDCQLLDRSFDDWRIVLTIPMFEIERSMTPRRQYEASWFNVRVERRSVRTR